ncbi:MAG: hypothetical protein NXH94_04555 [Rhodobacteraceae bacterium]|jgi:hypothetical protein|nr:hypothetical protein [Paracoccaceae bacterium]
MLDLSTRYCGLWWPFKRNLGTRSAVTGIAIVAQLVGIALVLRLNRQHFARRAVPACAVPAE